MKWKIKKIQWAAVISLRSWYKRDLDMLELVECCINVIVVPNVNRCIQSLVAALTLTRNRRYIKQIWLYIREKILIVRACYCSNYVSGVDLCRRRADHHGYTCARIVETRRCIFNIVIRDQLRTNPTVFSCQKFVPRKFTRILHIIIYVRISPNSFVYRINFG